MLYWIRSDASKPRLSHVGRRINNLLFVRSFTHRLSGILYDRACVHPGPYSCGSYKRFISKRPLVKRVASLRQKPYVIR